jgi:hypothetical protein
MTDFVPWGQVTCPYCGAGVGQSPCRDARGAEMDKPHASRIDRAKQATRENAERTRKHRNG